MTFSPAEITLITITFIASGMVKGVVGMGLPMLAMGLLGLVMAPVEAVALLVIPSLVTNIWQLLAGPKLIALLKRFATTMIGVCIGASLGVNVLAGGPPKFVSIALGVTLALYGVYGVYMISRMAKTGYGFFIKPSAENWCSPLIGVTTGLVAGATGIFALPLVPYLNTLALDKEALIQTLGLAFTVSTIALAVGLMWHGKFQITHATASFAAVVPALIGMWFGQLLRKRMNAETFRKWFFRSLILLGIYMAVRSL